MRKRFRNRWDYNIKTDPGSEIREVVVYAEMTLDAVCNTGPIITFLLKLLYVKFSTSV